MAKSAEVISTLEAQRLLRTISMTVGDWHRMGDANESDARYTKKFDPPLKPAELYIFSQHVAGWLPKGEWKILQFDDSTALRVDEVLLFSAILDLPYSDDLSGAHSILFSFGEDPLANAATEILISHLLYLILLFEAHAYLTSSASQAGEMVAIQDGVILLSSRRDIQNTEPIEQLSTNTLKIPEWILKLENDIASS